MSNPVRVWLALLGLMLFGYGAYTYLRDRRPDTAPEVAPAPRPVRPLDDFELTERAGDNLRLESLRGQVWAASFFFASCPGTCLKMNQSIADLHAEFGPLGVKFVSVTVDPKNDTPERLRSYADKLGIKGDPKTWLFLTGDFQDIADLGQGVFQVTVEPKTHSDRIVLVGGDGRVVGTYNALDTIAVDAFKKKVRALLDKAPAKNAPPAESAAATPAKAS
jgi:protein SCO1/2